jgi:ATP-binding cassette subfamily B protein/ATP-binding cassette subfamily C protein LapB
VIALPLFTLNVYDAVVPNLAMSTLTVFALGVGIAIFFDVLLKSARTSTLERVAARTGTTFDRELMQRMLSVREEHMQLSVGERCNLFRELQGLRDFYASRFIPALVDFPFFLLFLLIIYLISPALALVPVGVAVSILALNALVQIPVNRSTKALFASTQKKSSLMVEMLTGTAALKQLNATAVSLNRWNNTSELAAEAARKSQYWVSIGQHGSLGLIQLNHVLTVFVGVHQIKNGSLTVGGLVAATILASRTLAPILALHSVIARWTQSRDFLRTIDMLFSQETDRSDSRVVPTTPLRGGIQVREFSYTYPQQPRAAVKDINLSIKPGEHVCLIGPSGAGKSTLARAIAGALVSSEGQISIDEYSYESLTAARIRSGIAYLPQHPFFIAGTVRENLLLGITHCSEERLAKAVNLAGLDNVLSQCSSGLDTAIGENGRQLSGGQKQAISIARAILCDAQVLVFDEPTNGLDSALERQFMQTMQAFARHRTLLMVTHRTSLVSLADRVIVMDKGVIVADGPREAVMQRFAA